MDLPTYRYEMTANAVLIIDGICYEARQILPKPRQFFSDPMIVKTNQPIHKGDLLKESCLMDSSDLISEFVKQYLFDEPDEQGENLVENENEYKDKTSLCIEVCRVDHIRLEYATSKDEFHGNVTGTIFATLIPTDTYETITSLETSLPTSINKEMTLSLYRQIGIKDSVDFWKEQIPDWTKKFTCIGLASDLIG